jgi:hypothetical protein
MNSQASPASPTISRIRTRNTRAASIYQSGIDFYFDWGVSHFLSKQVFVGLVGYAYQQITDDFGQPAVLGGFRSRVLGIGPQLGYIFPVGDMTGFLGVKGYGEFDAANRPSGWNTSSAAGSATSIDLPQDLTPFAARLFTILPISSALCADRDVGRGDRQRECIRLA